MCKKKQKKDASRRIFFVGVVRSNFPARDFLLQYEHLEHLPRSNHVTNVAE